MDRKTGIIQTQELADLPRIKQNKECISQQVLQEHFTLLLSN